MRIKSAILMTSVLAAIAGQSLAYETGDIILRAGAAYVAPDVTDKVAGGALKLDVNNDTQLGLTATYMVAPQIGIGVLAATPFSHDITAGGIVIGETKHLPPTLTLQWHPKINDTVQPYLGAGVNYTVFWDAKLNATGQAATGASKLSLTHSVGLALEAGVDVKVTNNVYINAAIWRVDINTDVKLNGVKAGELEIDPMAYMIGVGYKF